MFRNKQGGGGGRGRRKALFGAEKIHRYLHLLFVCSLSHSQVGLESNPPLQFFFKNVIVTFGMQISNAMGTGWSSEHTTLSEGGATLSAWGR